MSDLEPGQLAGGRSRIELRVLVPEEVAEDEDGVDSGHGDDPDLEERQRSRAGEQPPSGDARADDQASLADLAERIVGRDQRRCKQGRDEDGHPWPRAVRRPAQGERAAGRHEQQSDPRKHIRLACRQADRDHRRRRPTAGPRSPSHDRLAVPATPGGLRREALRTAPGRRRAARCRARSTPCESSAVGSRVRVVGRRVVVVAVVALQVFFVARGYWSDHKEFAFQMFPESSTWRADVVRVTADGRRVPVETPWSGYRWHELVPNVSLSYRRSADTRPPGSHNQLAFLESALDWVASNTPRDHETLYLEARGDLLAQRGSVRAFRSSEAASASDRSPFDRAARQSGQPARRSQHRRRGCSPVRVVVLLHLQAPFLSDALDGRIYS